MTRLRIRATGVVQGVGFRPFVHRLAAELDLAGFVGNDPGGVFIEVEGPGHRVEQFVGRLSAEAPAMAAVESVSTRPVELVGEHEFTIVASLTDDAGPAASSGALTLVPADTATCTQCLAETLDPADRRYRYPFTACTYCGPRFTMVTGLPYDRPSTTMAGFALCDPCRREYEDPADRRFHAQPTACPACGPSLSFRQPGRVSDGPRADAALAAALGVLRGGGVVAVKGIGGYHLVCDATRPEAVAQLRRRKQRSDKPFAVLVPDLAAASHLVDVDEVAAHELTSAVAPIVVLPVADRDDARAIARSVAPGVGSVGVMLAYTPLHHLLFQPHPLTQPAWTPRALVFTSGNLSDEPICTDADEAEQRLGDLADAFLHHDRPIHVACDDSVERVDPVAGLMPVRRSRGHAPLPVRLPVVSPPLVAVGGELKATVCVASGERAWLTQHLGDMASLATLSSLERSLDVLLSLTGVTPGAMVADRHPGYLSQRWARERAASLGVPCLLVQHHHAHVAALLAEHAVPPGHPVLGFAFDGTGFGDDATIWGGEILLGSYAHVERVGHLAPVQLPGGDAAVRRPSRVALSHLVAAGLPDDMVQTATPWVDEVERRAVASMLRSGTGCVATTSMGRLFDAVAALVGVGHEVTYEGQAAIELEALSALADPESQLPPGYRFDVDEHGVMDPAPLLRRCVSDLLAGAPPSLVGRRFHEALAASVVEVALSVRRDTGVRTVGLTGGVFQNAMLTGLARTSLEASGFDVLVHRVVPPNDGGLALGQVAVAAAGGAKESG